MAANLSFSSDDELVSSINITPLVDVVLVLLVIFLMTAPVIYQSAIKVELPKANTGEQASTSPLLFTLDRESNVSWGQEKLSWDELTRRLVALKANAPDETAIINADQATAHGTVVRLMDLLREVGINRFAMNVEAPGPSSSTSK